MPTYAYRCEAGHQFEAAQGINDPALTRCASCGASVRRMVYPVGIVFKGQGFYKTDSRSSSSSSVSPAVTDAKNGSSESPAPAQADGVGDATKAAKPKKKDSASESAIPAGGGA